MIFAFTMQPSKFGFQRCGGPYTSRLPTDEIELFLATQSAFVRLEIVDIIPQIYEEVDSALFG